MENVSIKQETKAKGNKEIDCITVDSDDADCNTVILKRKRSNKDPIYTLSDDDSETVKTPKRKRVVRKTEKSSTKVKPRATKLCTTKRKIKNESTKSNSDGVTVMKVKKDEAEFANFDDWDYDVETKPKIHLKDAWCDYELLAEKENLHSNTADTIIKLFEAGNTIPFIARYRKHLTNDMSAEKLRDVKESYEHICALKSRTVSVLKTIEKAGKLSVELKKCILNCKTLPELEHIYAPFKPGSKRTLAERAKSLGLEEAALAILTGSSDVDLQYLVQNNGPEGLRNAEEVERNIIHIIAHTISTDTDVLTFIRDLRQTLHLKIECKKSASTSKVDTSENVSKFENYFNFQVSVNYVKPHQVLAINRGENLKILSVKVIVPEYAFNRIKYFCENKWLNGKSNKNGKRIHILQESVKDAYKRLISPLIVRQTRAELKATAEKASIEVFTVNLKKLLLGSPLKGKPIMGVDPGFSVGCKLAVISSSGDVLDTGVIYPHTKKSSQDHVLVKELLTKHKCSLLALGNGTACRETEKWITHLIQSNTFHPLDVRYTIVDECGASIYSCSPEAKKEFPNMDPLVISAGSLARRVQDPLAELVKVEPKHLGVGMYQHDLNKKALESALDEVVTECVSFVGVDLNTASQCLLRYPDNFSIVNRYPAAICDNAVSAFTGLRKVAGLTTQRADSIIKHRQTKGPFTNRYQLKDVKGVGEKVFEQCAGFLRVGPPNPKESNEFYERPETMPLDCTWIHPESYDLVEKIMLKLDLNYKHIGLPGFIKSFRSTIGQLAIAQLALECEASEATVQLIIDVLSRPLDHDLRQENPQEPLFRKGVTSMNDIKTNMVLTGRVTNVTHFGAFVDIGVGQNGLIHTSAMRGCDVQLGDRVEVRVRNIDIEKGRIGLEAVSKM